MSEAMSMALVRPRPTSKCLHDNISGHLWQITTFILLCAVMNSYYSTGEPILSASTEHHSQEQAQDF